MGIERDVFFFENEEWGKKMKGCEAL
jgi:hypothetical protein